VEVRHAAAALAAAQVFAQFNRGAIRAEALNVAGGVEDALVLAPPGDGDERHLGLDKLAERPAEASLTRVAIAGAHSEYVPTGDLAGLWNQGTRRRSAARIVRRGRARQSRRGACPGLRGAMSASEGRATILRLGRRSGS
jgi:hypothetical protein